MPRWRSHETCSIAPPTCLPAGVGVLKGYDRLLNLVLDEATEFLRGVHAFGMGQA